MVRGVGAGDRRLLAAFGWDRAADLRDSRRSLEEHLAGRRKPQHSFLLIVLALFVSAAAGVAVLRVPPLFIVGALVCALAVYVIVSRPFVGLLFYTAAFMLRPGQIYPALSALHVERVIGALALAGMYLRQHHVSRRLQIDGTRTTALLLAVALAVVVSIPFSYLRGASVHGFIEFLKLLAWYLLVVHLLDRPRRLRGYVTLFLILICYIAFDSLRAFLSGSVWHVQGIDRLRGTTDAGGDPNHLAATIAATISFLLLLTFHKPLRWYRLFPAAGVLLLTYTTSVTGSRSGLLGYLGAIVFLWTRVRHRLLVGVLGSIILVGAFFALPEQYKARYSTIGQKKIDSSSQGRITAWKKGVQMMFDRPLNGVGIDCFGVANWHRYSPEDNRSALEAHSLYAQLPAEIGFPGAICFFAFLISILRLASRKSRELIAEGSSWCFEEIVLRSISAGIFALLITGVFGHSFLRHTWYVYGALTVAVLRVHENHLSGSAQATAKIGHRPG